MRPGPTGGRHGAGTLARHAYTRLSEGSVRQMIRRGTIPSHKIEGRRLLRREEVDKALVHR